MFLQGQYLEAGMQQNASLGSGIAALSGYHPHNSTAASLCSTSSVNLLASVYDWGKDGWSTGSPAYMGDYTLPGSPWEGWAVEVNGQTRFAYSTSCSFTGSLGGNGSFSSWTSIAGSAIGNWSGTFGSGSSLGLRKEYRIDTLSSALVITVTFTNNTASPLTGVYYMRTCDPDNSRSWSGGSFRTVNSIVYQNDYYHRVMVTATACNGSGGAFTPPSPYSLGTKDCRAEALIYTSWPMSTSCNLANVYAMSAGCLSTAYYTLGAKVTADIAIGLIYNVGTIAANDSAVISFAYIYDGTAGLDTAFPEPELMANGALQDTVDTITVCSGAASPIPLDVLYGTDKSWTWSDWTWSPAIGLSSTTGVSTTLDPSVLAGTTTYTINGTNSRMANCVQRTFLLTIIPVSTAPPTARDTTYCQGIVPLPITFNVTTSSGTLMWYTAATGGIGTTTTPVISTTTAGVTTYYVSQINAGCESPRAPINITVAPPPVVSLTNNGPLCPGDLLIITLTDTLTSTTLIYSWSGPGTFSATTQNVVISSCVATDSGVYTVVVDNNGCSTAPTSTTVVVHSTPPSPIFTNPTYCQYLSSVPLSATGTNILWYASAVGGTGSTIAPTPSTTVAGTFTFYVTQTINNCESPRYPVIARINPKPAPPTIIDIPGEYCPNEAFIPFTIPAGTGSVRWYAAATGGGGTTTAPIVSTAFPGTYYVWATQSFLGCESDRQQISIIIDDSVKAHYSITKQLGCNADTILFNNTSYGAINYLWDFGDGYSSALANPIHVYPTQGVYIVKLYAHSLNCIDSVMKTIDTRHPLHANFSLSPGLVCQGSLVKFTDSTIATGPTYLWKFGDGTTSVLSNPTHVYSYTGTYKVTLIIKDAILCIDSFSLPITVDSLSLISMQITDTVLCRGTFITLSANYSDIGNTGIIWNFGNGDSVKNKNPVVYAYGTIGTFNVTATAHYRVCADAVVTRPVIIIKQPSIDLGPDTSICIGSESILLSDYMNAGNPAAHWLWSTGQETAGIMVTEAGTYAVTVKIGGCAATDSVFVNNNCIVNISNCFSPNKDGVNDYFNPRDFFTKGLKSFSMTIYNRWGQVVFETNAIDGRGWDGYFNSMPQPAGVFIYNINADFIDGQKLNKHGNLTLIR